MRIAVPTAEGSPQGGVISPLIANVALHGLETSVAEAHPKAKVIRYADDLVVLHPDLAMIQAAKHTVEEWLAKVGLELKPSKTSITHSLRKHQGRVGFDFLGFHIRQYRIGKTHSGKTGGLRSRLLGFKTIIKPSQTAVSRHYQSIKEVIGNNLAATQAQLIGQLNPIIRGWANYYATVSSSDTFARLSYLTYYKLERWARRRHPNKSRHWVSRRYWRLETGYWLFAPQNGRPLHRHDETPIKRHIKVRGHKSLYDGDWVYWAKRRGQPPGLPKRVAILLKRQAGKCANCELYFRPEDKPQVDHVTPRTRGGKDGYNNWQLLHTHCHHQKTAKDKHLQQLETLMSAASQVRSRMRVTSQVRF
jgi:RNA-directed DNA polymerase